MNRYTELFKKFGAGLIVIVLALIMGISFSRSFSMSEIVNLMTMGTNQGHFNGKSIPKRVVGTYRSLCDSQIREEGRQPQDMEINFCAMNRIQEGYLLSSLGEKMGIRSSKNYVEQNLKDSIRRVYANQVGVHQDDLLSMNDLLKREIRRYSVEDRIRDASASRVYEQFNGFPLPQELSESLLLADRLTLNLSLVRYNNADLLRVIDPSVSVSEAQVREEYEKEQQKLPEAERKPYSERKGLIRSRLKSSVKQRKLAEVKQALSGVSRDGIDLKRVSAITGIPVIQKKGVMLNSLAGISLNGKEKVKLIYPDFLLKLEKLRKEGSVVAGPFQDGEYTIYVEATAAKMSGPDRLTPAQMAGFRSNLERYVGSLMLNDLVKAEAKKGEFTLNRWF